MKKIIFEDFPPIDGEVILPNECTYLYVKNFIFNNKGVLKIEGNNRKLEIIAETTNIGKNCKIIADSTVEGGNGPILNMSFGDTTIEQLTISANGHQGKKGINGVKGRTGSPATDFHNAGGGGSGTPGQQGLPGGRGGIVNLVVKSDKNIKKLQIETSGGEGGEGGEGGAGGAGGSGNWNHHGGNSGQPGPKGPIGSPGVNGSYRVIIKDYFTKFSDLLPIL